MDAAMDVDTPKSNDHCSPTPDVLSPEDHTTSLNHHTSHFGTVIPNRIFVGGIDCQDNESDLLHFFSQHGVVKEVKIVIDSSSGMSKGYGFVTFETQEEAQKVLHDANGISFKDKKLSVGQAVRKKHTSRQNLRIPVFNPHHAKPLTMSGGALYLTTPTDYSYTYHNGTAYFHCPSMNPPAHHWQAAPPMMLPQSYQPVYHQPANHHCQCLPNQCVPNQCQPNFVQPVMPTSPVVYSQQSENLYQSTDGGFVQTPLHVMDTTPENPMFPNSWVHLKPRHQPYIPHNSYQYLHESAEPWNYPVHASPLLI